ncbi:MAG: rhodanese-like domain-containing protein [Acidobacteriota bacterium]
MQKLTAVMAVSLLTAGLAYGQMKTPQTRTPQMTATGAGSSPVVITPVVQPQAPLESARRIKRDEAMKLVKAGKAVYVDVRSKDSFDAGHIKGALNIPLSELLTRLKEVPTQRTIITYCA